jgi:protease I
MKQKEYYLKKVLNIQKLKTIMSKKILIVVPEQDFRDEEYFIPYSFFERKGYQVDVMGVKKGIAVGVYGGEAVINITPHEFEAKNFQAVVFVGGPGSIKYLDNEDFYEVIRKSREDELVLGAICISPLILLNAGVLKNKKVTVWSSEMDKKAVLRIKEGKALYQNEDVVCDDWIVTANGPEVAEEFALKIIETIDKKVEKGI